MKIFNIYKYTLFFYLLFIGGYVIAQSTDSITLNKRIDSVYTLKNDSVFAFSTVNDVIKKAEEINYKSGIAAAMQLKGYLYFEYGDFDNAKKYLYEAYAINKMIKNDKVMAQNLRLLAIYLEAKDDYYNALEYLLQSLQIRKKLKDEKGIAECYISMGIINHRTSKFQGAITYYKMALAYFKTTKFEKTIGAINSNLGAAYNEMGKLDSALIFLKQVVISKQKIKDNIGLGKAYHNLATTYSLLGKYNYALNYYLLSLKSSGGGENNSNNAITYEAAGSMLTKLKRYDEAEKYLKISEKIYKENELNQLLVDCYNKLAVLYENREEFDKSLKYHTLGNILKDSLQHLYDESSFFEIEAKYKAIEKTKENELLSAKNEILERKSENNTILAFSLAIVILASIFLAINLRTVKNTKDKLVLQNLIIETKNKEADIQNENLEKLIEENQNLMGILAHDLRSPLIKIAGLINLIEEEETDADDKLVFINYIQGICKDSLQLIQDTIDLSEIFHEKNANLNAKMEIFSATEMISDLMNSFKGIALEKGIEIEVNNGLQGVNLNNSKEYLNRVLDNLLSNAIKFSPKNSSITFTTYKENDFAVFIVKDQGPGLTDSDKNQLFMRFKKLSARPTGNEASSGLGLFIVKQLVELIGGEVNVESELGKGAAFILRIPIINGNV